MSELSARKGTWREVVKAMPREQGEESFERWKLENQKELESIAPDNIRIEVLRAEGGEDWFRVAVFYPEHSSAPPGGGSDESV